MSVIFDIFPRCPLNRQHIPCSKYRKKRVPVRVLVLVPFPVPEGITFGQYQHECQYHDHWPVPVARVSVPVRIANLPLQRTPHSITIQFKYYAWLLCPPSPPNLRNSVVNFFLRLSKNEIHLIIWQYCNVQYFWQLAFSISHLQACKAHKCSVRIKIAVADNVEKLQPFRCCANLAFWSGLKIGPKFCH